MGLRGFKNLFVYGVDSHTMVYSHTVAVNMAMTKERLISSDFYDLATAYQSVHVNY